MGRARVFFSVAAVAAALATIGTRAQTTAPQQLDIREGVGLAAVDEGVLKEQTHTPDSFETRRRLAMRATLHGDAISLSGAAYKRGRMIVKFKDGVSASARAAAIASASLSGSIAARPSYANFDIVNVDPSEDA